MPRRCQAILISGSCTWGSELALVSCWLGVQRVFVLSIALPFTPPHARSSANGFSSMALQHQKTRNHTSSSCSTGSSTCKQPKITSTRQHLHLQSQHYLQHPISTPASAEVAIWGNYHALKFENSTLAGAGLPGKAATSTPASRLMANHPRIANLKRHFSDIWSSNAAAQPNKRVSGHSHTHLQTK